MADKKVSELTAAVSIDPADLFLIIHFDSPNENLIVTGAQLREFCVQDGLQLFDGSHLLAADFGARKFYADDGTTEVANLSATDAASIGPDNVVKGGYVLGRYMRAWNNGAALGTGSSVGVGGAANWGFALGFGTTAVDEGVALSAVCAASGYNAVSLGQAAVSYPHLRVLADGSDTVTIQGDQTYGDGIPDPRSFYRVGDGLYLFPYGATAVPNTLPNPTISSITGTTITLSATVASGQWTLIGSATANSCGAVGMTQATLVFDVGGDQQVTSFVMQAATSNATATRLTADNEGGSGSYEIRIWTGQVRAFQIDCVGQKSNGDTYRSILKGVIKNISGTVSLVGSVTKEEWFDSGASAWVIAATADNTDKLLAVTVTGAAASNIRWIAHVKSTEVAWFPDAA